MFEEIDDYFNGVGRKENPFFPSSLEDFLEWVREKQLTGYRNNIFVINSGITYRKNLFVTINPGGEIEFSNSKDKFTFNINDPPGSYILQLKKLYNEYFYRPKITQLLFSEIEEYMGRHYDGEVYLINEKFPWSAWDLINWMREKNTSMKVSIHISDWFTLNITQEKERLDGEGVLEIKLTDRHRLTIIGLKSTARSVNLSEYSYYFTEKTYDVDIVVGDIKEKFNINSFSIREVIFSDETLMIESHPYVKEIKIEAEIGTDDDENVSVNKNYLSSLALQVKNTLSGFVLEYEDFILLFNDDVFISFTVSGNHNIDLGDFEFYFQYEIHLNTCFIPKSFYYQKGNPGYYEQKLEFLIESGDWNKLYELAKYEGVDRYTKDELIQFANPDTLENIVREYTKGRKSNDELKEEILEFYEEMPREDLEKYVFDIDREIRKERRERENINKLADDLRKNDPGGYLHIVQRNQLLRPPLPPWPLSLNIKRSSREELLNILSNWLKRKEFHYEDISKELGIYDRPRKREKLREIIYDMSDTTYKKIVSERGYDIKPKEDVIISLKERLTERIRAFRV